MAAGDRLLTSKHHGFSRAYTKVIADEPRDFSVLLGSNSKETTGPVSGFEYCPELRDGDWPEVVIPNRPARRHSE